MSGKLLALDSPGKKKKGGGKGSVLCKACLHNKKFSGTVIRCYHTPSSQLCHPGETLTPQTHYETGIVTKALWMRAQSLPGSLVDSVCNDISELCRYVFVLCNCIKH